MEKAEALAEIFTSPSDEEDFTGFGAAPPLDPSEDSRDSWHSARSGKPGLCFQSRYITDELIRIFSEETDSEEEEFEGFSWDGSPHLSSWMKTVSETEEASDEDNGFYSKGESKALARRRSSGLCVAFRFPLKKGSASGEQKPSGTWSGAKLNGTTIKSKQRHSVKSLPSQWSPKLDSEEETEELRAQSERARNIQENKAMLAKLFADLNSIPELSPVKTPRKRRRMSRKEHLSEGGFERRNPVRSARPPERFAVEEPPVKEPRKYQRLDTKKLLEVNENSCKKRLYRAKRKQNTFRSVEDITEEELENVAFASKDKIHDKEHGSTCHQCRQKTLDTKTVCRNPSCGGVRGQFCGPCLRNRYGEDVRTALLDPSWECPRCRGICNCSLCRRQDGRCATGALVSLARFYGHGNVREYLDSLQKELS
ncbi:cell division cycle-associated 7-like protein [Arapaima gigas]